MLTARLHHRNLAGQNPVSWQALQNQTGLPLGLLVWLLATVGACGDNLEGLAFEDLEASRRSAECERLTRCGLFGDASTCRKYFRKTQDESLNAAVDAGKIRFDPVAGVSCNRALASRSCDITVLDGREIPPVCKRVLVGTVGSGATCAADRECATARCDAPTCSRSTCCFGGCEPFVAPSKLDEACDRASGCVAAAFCGRDGECRPLSNANGPCDVDTDCIAGLGCTGATELEVGTCRPLPKLGEGCPYLRCAEIGARCDGQRCVPYGRVGDACGISADCSEFRICDQASRRCVDKPTLGMPCTESCRGEAWCDFTSGPNGTCRAFQPNAVPCFASDECATRYCEEGSIFNQCASPAVCY